MIVLNDIQFIGKKNISLIYSYTLYSINLNSLFSYSFCIFYYFIRIERAHKFKNVNSHPNGCNIFHYRNDQLTFNIT